MYRTTCEKAAEDTWSVARRDHKFNKRRSQERVGVRSLISAGVSAMENSFWRLLLPSIAFATSLLKFGQQPLAVAKLAPSQLYSESFDPKLPPTCIFPTLVSTVGRVPGGTPWPLSECSDR